VIELPFVPHRTAAVNSRAITDLFPRHLREEYRETHLLAIWAHDRGLVHSNKEVRTQDDLRGLKLRFPTRLAGEALRALGAAPVGMPVPQVPEAVAQRVIDGAVVPWEVVPSIRLHELVRHHTDIPGSPTLYTTSFVLAMNPARYQSLPADLKAVLDANSGLAAAELAAKVWDEQGPVVERMVRGRSQNSIVSITEEEAGKWRAATQPVVEAWVAQTRERNFDGGALLEETRALITRLGAGA
jgi:TRAP-type C4-dicarboxylate transport system substrate-binding protein